MDVSAGVTMSARIWGPSLRRRAGVVPEPAVVVDDSEFAGVAGLGRPFALVVVLDVPEPPRVEAVADGPGMGLGVRLLPLDDRQRVDGAGVFARLGVTVPGHAAVGDDNDPGRGRVRRPEPFVAGRWDVHDRFVALAVADPVHVAVSDTQPPVLAGDVAAQVPPPRPVHGVRPVVEKA